MLTNCLESKIRFNIKLFVSLIFFQTVQAIHICNRDHRLKMRHQPVIHSLLGLYSMSMNVGNTAEFHLRAVLAVSISN